MNALNPVLRVRDQLGDAIDAHLKLERRERQERLGELLDLVGIPRERLRSYPHELSGGMRQRVMIAMALAAEPEVVIMDEPTTALDVVVQREILARSSSCSAELGFAVLFITHDLSLLLEIADRIAVMYAGRIVEIGSAEKIHNEPSHPYTQGLLGSFPSVRGPRRELAGIPGSPPDLRASPPGCPFAPRCPFATRACRRSTCACSPVRRGCEPPHRVPVRSLRRRSSSSAAASAVGPSGGGRDEHSATDAGECCPRRRALGPLVLEAHALAKDYRLSHGPHGVVLSAVRDVSFELHRSAVVALVGESGSGKSTVARMLAGQERPTGGEILLDGVRVAPPAARRSGPTRATCRWSSRTRSRR